MLSLSAPYVVGRGQKWWPVLLPLNCSFREFSASFPKPGAPGRVEKAEKERNGKTIRNQIDQNIKKN